MLRRLRVLTVIVVLVEASGMSAQNPSVEAQLEQVAGLAPDGAEEFLTRLRRGLGTLDRPAVCDLVAYPLQHSLGTVADAAACVARFDEIFTIPVRRAVGRQQFADLFVSDRGAMTGQGELWFAGVCRSRPCGLADIRITAVNSHPENGLRPPRGYRFLHCVAGGQRVEISANGTGGVELRIWGSAQATGTPAVEALDGSEGTDSVGGCPQRRWSFSAGSSDYTVTEVSCASDTVVPPMGSVGRITRRVAGNDEEALWCFE